MKRFLVLTVAMLLLVGAMFSTTVLAENKEPVDFLLTYPKDKVVLYTLIDEFTEKTGYPVNIMYMPLDDAKKQINVMVAGDSLPDVMDIDAVVSAAYAEMGILVDITDRVKAEIPLDQYYEGPLDFSMWNDKFYSLPFTTNNVALYYNKDMFEAAGIQNPPATWSELIDCASKLTTDSVFGFGVSGAKSGDTPFQFLPFFWQAGGTFDQFNAEPAVAALNMYKTMIDKGYMSTEIINWTAGDNANNFIAGKTAMIIDGTWRLGSVAKGATFKWGVAQLPTGTVSKATTLGGHNIAITSEKNIEGAWALMKYFQEPEVMQRFGEAENYLPARKDVMKASAYFNEGEIAVFSQSAEFAKARGPMVNWPSFDTALQEMIQAVALNAKTPEQAVADAAAVLEK